MVNNAAFGQAGLIAVNSARADSYCATSPSPADASIATIRHFSLCCCCKSPYSVSEMMGAEIYLYLEYKGNKMTARVAPTSKARNGDTVRVAFDPHKVHLFDIETELTILN